MQPPALGCLRKIILLTDVQVVNEVEILALAQRYQGQATVWLAKQTGESIEVFRLIASLPHLPKRSARRVVATLTALFLLHTRFQKWQAE